MPKLAYPKKGGIGDVWKSERKKHARLAKKGKKKRR